MGCEQTNHLPLWQTLGLRPGLCAILGSGGKTSVLLQLARELPGRVIVCTSTRIFPPELPTYTGSDAATLAQWLAQRRVVCAATPAAEGKLAAPGMPFATLIELADYVLVEADGSKHLPLKAHLAHEPVVPPETTQRILVTGVTGFGQPIELVAHRSAQFCALCGRLPEELARPCDIAAVLRAEALSDTVLVNQVETPAQLELARTLAALLPDCRVWAAAVQKGRWQAL